MTTPLSPAAQAVVTAIEKFDWEAGHFSREEIWFCSREVVAAALRAAAMHLRSEEYAICNGSSYAMMIEIDDLLDLATELETHD